MKKKVWAIFSGLGFAFLSISLIEVIRVRPDFSNPIAFVGLIIFMIGIGITLNSVLWLSIKKSESPLKKDGVYKIVRHPMYLGGILLAIGLVFASTPLSLSQLFMLGLGVICFFTASHIEDSFNVEKFGEDYKKYIEKTPALNFFKGIKNKN